MLFANDQDNTQNWITFLTVFLGSIPALLTAIAIFIKQIRSDRIVEVIKQKVDTVGRMVNGHTDKLVEATSQLKHAQGVAEGAKAVLQSQYSKNTVDTIESAAELVATATAKAAKTTEAAIKAVEKAEKIAQDIIAKTEHIMQQKEKSKTVEVDTMDVKNMNVKEKS